MSIYGFRGGPTYRPQTKESFWAAALDEPMNPVATFFDQAKGGALESFGLGTVARDVAIPKGNVTPQSNFADQVIAGVPGFGQSYLGIRNLVQSVINPPEPPMTETAYKASEYFRTDVPWDGAMTETRAAALADWYDAKKVREFYAEKQPIAAFFGNLTGQAMDPINYVPIAGPAVKAAAVARFGTVAGHVAAGALDAAANTAIFGAATAPARRQYGDDVSWQMIVSDVAMAALIGGAFGGAGGILAKRADGKAARLSQVANDNLSTLKATQESRIALNDAVAGLAEEGNVRLSPNAIDPIADMSRRANPAQSPDLFADIERPNLFTTTAVGRLVDGRALPVQDFETFVRNDVLAKAPELKARYDEAEAKFIAAQDRVAAIEEPINARTTADSVSLIDPASGERLRVVEQELAAKPSKVKRSALEQERDSIVESIGSEAVGKAESDFRIGPAKQAKNARKALTTARQNFSKVRREADTIAQGSLAINRAIYMPKTDTTAARPEPLPQGRAEAASAAPKPDTTKAMAETYRVDSSTGAFLEEPEIAQIEAEGRLTEEDRTAMSQSLDDFDNGAAYGEALKAAVGCLI